MSSPKIISNDRRLSSSIKEIGALLGEILIEQEGKQLFDNVEKLRALTKNLRAENKTETIQKIKKNIVARLSSDETHNVIKVFSIYFILVNAADEVNKIISDKTYEIESAPKKKSYLDEAF